MRQARASLEPLFHKVGSQLFNNTSSQIEPSLRLKLVCVERPTNGLAWYTSPIVEHPSPARTSILPNRDPEMVSAAQTYST